MYKTFNNNFPKIKQDIYETKSKINNNNFILPSSKEKLYLDIKPRSIL